MSTRQATGGCLCGAVRYRTRVPPRDVIVCHCSRCRRGHGHAAAFSACPREALEVDDPEGALRWYEHEGARHGFCGTCGGRLFWERPERPTISIAAGTLDEPTGLTTVLHIHVESAGDYEVLDEVVERRPD